jgi:hypothetical protein
VQPPGSGGRDLDGASYETNRTVEIGRKFPQPLFQINQLVQQFPNCWTNIARQTGFAREPLFL